MKNSLWTKLKEFMMLFVTSCFIYSCSLDNETADLQEADLQTEKILKKTDMLTSNMRIAPAVSCAEGCIEEGSEIFYPVSDMASLRVGKNSKSVSYIAYNTETDFVVEVTFAITAGPAKAKATITTDIDGNIMEYSDVSSGSTISHTMPLAQDWAGCDQVAFNIVQDGLGTPITFSESYSLIPVCEEVSLEIGAVYQGGIIAYILQVGDPGYDARVPHGLIAATTDISINNQRAELPWGCLNGDSNDIPILSGARGTAIGTGNQNTIDIITECSEQNIAAKLSADFTSGGYSDWFLPSSVELDKLRANREIIGGFDDNLWYWSSTQIGSGAYAYWFIYENVAGPIDKVDRRAVRPIRYF